MSIELFLNTAHHGKRGVSVQIKRDDGTIHNITLLKSSWKQLISQPRREKRP